MTVKELILAFGVKNENKQCFTKEKKSVDFDIVINDLKNKFQEPFNEFCIVASPYLIVTNKRTEEGGFFESTRIWEQTITFHEDFMVLWRHVDSKGWDKQIDYATQIYYRDVLAVDRGLNVEIGYGIVTAGIFTCLNFTVDIQKFKTGNPTFIKKFEDNGVLKGSTLRYPDFNHPNIEIDDEMITMISEICLRMRIQYQTDSEILNQKFLNLLGGGKIDFQDLSSFCKMYSNEFTAINLLSAVYARLNCDIDGARIKFKSALKSLADSESGITQINETLFNLYYKFNEEEGFLEDQLNFLDKYGSQFLNEDEQRDNVDKLLKISAIASLLQEEGNESELLIVNNDGISKRVSTFTTLDKSHIPSEFLFPAGHPKPDVSYVKHPLITNRFIPIQNFEKVLFDDKVSEFSRLIQALGATEIEYLSADNLQSKSSINSTSSASGNGHTKLGKIAISKEDTNKVEDEWIKNEGYSRRQKFIPIEKPYVPDDLLWFHHESQWQSLARQRLYGNLTDHIEQISISETNILNSVNQSKLNSEIKTVFSGLEGNFETTLLTSIQNSANKETFVRIKFKPIEEFNKPIIPKTDLEVPVVSKDNLTEIFKTICQQNGKLNVEATIIFEKIAQYVKMDVESIENGLTLLSYQDEIENEQ